MSPKELMEKFASFECHNCNNNSDYLFKEQTAGTRRQQKVNIDVLLTHGMKISLPTNRSKWRRNKLIWNQEEIQKLEERKSLTPKSTKITQRANLGYIPKRVVDTILQAGKSVGLDRNKAIEILTNMNTTIIEAGRVLYHRHLKKAWEDREEDGVPITNLKHHASKKPTTHFLHKPGIS